MCLAVDVLEEARLRPDRGDDEAVAREVLAELAVELGRSEVPVREADEGVGTISESRGSVRPSDSAG